MPKLTDEQAFEMVEKYIRKRGYDGELHCFEITRRDYPQGQCIDIALLRPYGLFIIRPDHSIEDNYGVFSK